MLLQHQDAELIPAALPFLATQVIEHSISGMVRGRDEIAHAGCVSQRWPV